MKKSLLIISIILFALSSTYAQNITLAEAKELYLAGEYARALPSFEEELQKKKNDASLNHWYGVCLYMTGGNLDIAEQALKVGASRKIQESNLYLGLLYTDWFDFEQAEKCFNDYEKHLTRKGWRSPAQKQEEGIALEKLKAYKKSMLQLRRIVSHTENIQIIDSIIVKKNNFLAVYNLSFSGGSIAPFSEVFKTNQPVHSTVYFNEKETKMYYSQPDTTGVYGLHTMEFLFDHFGNEKVLSKDNFGLEGSLNYPFIMTDGVTVYFAAEDTETIGGYDLFISRYNLNTDTYLKPERLNMPFNSTGNDYMMVIDEEKGIGWFASDRATNEGEVCIYTFIPNDVVKIIESEDNRYLANRARISSIKDTWVEGKNYSNLVTKAKTRLEKEEKKHKDFEFVINDDVTYHTLQDFKNIQARDIYFKVVQKKAELQRIKEQLETERVNYANANKASRRSLEHIILGLEDQQRNLYSEIPALEIQVRSIEISELTN